MLQLVGLHHAQVPPVLVFDDLQQMELPIPGGHSLFPALDSLSWVCRHNLHVLPAKPPADVADDGAVEPGLGPLLGHVPVGTAPLAAHDQVGSVRADACWTAWLRLASLLRPWEEHCMHHCKSQTYLYGKG